MDHFFLNSAAGSVYDLGSILDVTDGGPDFGYAALDQPVYAQNAARDGGVFAFESSRLRTMVFPFVLPSGFAGLSLDAAQAALRTAVRPGGAFVDLKPDGVPTGEMVRFDVLSGRVLPAYHSRERTVARVRGVLELDTQPFGYWPTEIVLASVGPASMPLELSWDPASTIGDAPALTRLAFHVDSPASPALSADTPVDSFWFGIGPSTGATTFLQPEIWYAATSETEIGSSGYPLMAATVRDDVAGVNGKLIEAAISPTLGRWTEVFRATVAKTEVSRYDGRWRALGWVRVQPSQAVPWTVALDVGFGFGGDILASGGHPPATVIPVGNPSWVDTASARAPTAFQLVDLGELSLPLLEASNEQQRMAFRLWAKPGTSNQGVASPRMELAGVQLVPVAQAAGFMPFGLIHPTWHNVVGTVPGGIHQGVLLNPNPVIDGIRGIEPYQGAIEVVKGIGRYYFGQWAPEIRPGLDSELVAGFAGHVAEEGATAARFHGARYQVAGSIKYRPRFSFVKGL